MARFRCRAQVIIVTCEVIRRVAHDVVGQGGRHVSADGHPDAARAAAGGMDFRREHQAHCKGKTAQRHA